MALIRYAILALGALALSACDLAEQSEPAPSPRARPDSLGPAVSPESERLAAFYAAREARLIAAGKLRQDYAPTDAPFDANTLARNFRRIALYDEYRPDAPGLVAEETVSQLRRWQKPVTIGVYHGPTTPAAQRRRDISEVRSFARRLGAITGLDVSFTSVANANFVVLFLNRDEMLTEPEKLRLDLPIMNNEVLRGLETLPDEIDCIAYGLTSRAPPLGYVGSIVAIRAEHAPRTRRSCIHEEMTQALGLANDNPNIRPSIFNDDEEFALLTRHDELLLKMLYDPRLRDGMTPETQGPILLEVARDAMRQSRI
ncbi:MAG: DUF2927 domain-containing protein [Pseudomonadota bacterium]